ncbi:MAG TPA: lycopene cyclase domain-containing protein [Edaphobacter sp.]
MLVATIVAMIVVPAALTLHTVRLSALNPAIAITPGASPYGYTVSLLLFIVPILVIAFWFLPQERVKISKKSFWWTIGLLFPLGAGLDFFFAQYFFTFPNESATLGIKAPALGTPIPIEEYVFYLTGFLCVLLLYIWLDEYWLSAYSIHEESAQRRQFHRLLKLHPESLILAIVLVAGAILFKKHFSSSPNGFPGYFIFLSLTALVPSSALLPSARPIINWRAFSLASLFVLLVSLIWEATLAIPYGWWNFRDEQMLGIRITAWGYLPIEEVCLWLAVTYATVIVYETVKCWKASEKSMRHALFGEPVSRS